MQRASSEVCLRTSVALLSVPGFYSSYSDIFIMIAQRKLHQKLDQLGNTFVYVACHISFIDSLAACFFSAHVCV